jgi:hypothetical protein
VTFSLLSTNYSIYVTIILLSNGNDMKMKVWPGSDPRTDARGLTGSDFLTVLLFPLLILIAPVAPHSLIFLPCALYSSLVTPLLHKQRNEGYGL